MAGCDYYSCDVCGSKTFYDANLSYDDNLENKITHHRWPDGYIGDMAVLCDECAKTHKIEIVERLIMEKVK